MNRPSRRVVLRRRLLALAGLALVGFVLWAVVLGGWLRGAVDERGAETGSLTIDSKAVGRTLPVKVVVPAGAAGETRPLLIFLHGRGADQNSELTDQMYSALADQGERAPIIAFPYGGESSYWHDRADGAWGRYVMAEVIPQVEARFDVDPKRLAIGGISMGGYGAFELAVGNPGRFCAVGGHSPAVWQDAGESAPGAFDDAEDFAAHDLIAEVGADPSALAATRLWIDAGNQDPFLPGDAALTSALRSGGDPVVRKTFPGRHEDAYWDAHWGDYLSFYAKALAAC